MEVRAFLIPPSSHFLKSLVNYLSKNLTFDSPRISQNFIIFPTKRACFFFKYYLTENLNNKSFFFPKILSWEEFLEFLYLKLTLKPSFIFPDSAKPLLFLKSLSGEQSNKDPLKLFFWANRFLEVFEEFEKEGKLPSNLLYPPEELPEHAKNIFKDLSKTYQNFKNLLKKMDIIFSSFLLKEVYDLLLHNKERIISFVDGLYFCGFAALRNIEKEIFQVLKEVLSESNKPVGFFFESTPSPHPIISQTLKSLNLNAEPLPEEYFERQFSESEPEIHFYTVPDIESEIDWAINLISGEASRPDSFGIVLPQSLTLLPLIHRLENREFEVNITLPFPTSFLPLNQFILTLLRAKKARKDNKYLSEDFFKIIDHPLLKALHKDEPFFFSLLKKLKDLFEVKKYLTISKEELEKCLSPLEKEFFCKLYKIFFENWENPETPERVLSALKELLEFFNPLFPQIGGSDDLYAYLTRAYISYLEKEVFPLFVYDPLWKDFTLPEKENLYLLYLEYLLNSQEISLFGDPLAGIQILGFLETRLLSFENLIVFDVNEDSLPPTPPLNPLLTEEIKRSLGFPIYRNELWDYYFERLISSSKRVHLFYLQSSKGRSELFKEPSRFVQKLKWRFEKKRKPLNISIYPLKFVNLKRLEALEKKEEDQQLLLSYVEKNKKLSRSFFETYLTCSVRFYFQYILGLKPYEETLFEERTIGNFLHSFFEKIFSDHTNKPLKFSELSQQNTWKQIFENLWKEFAFEKIFDPLSLWLSEKLAYASIENYFYYLSSLEKSGKIMENFIIGVEKDLFTKIPFNSSDLTLWGRIDFIVKRIEGITKYYLFDFKSNPHKAPAPNSIKNLIKFNINENYDRESLETLKTCFGKDLTNFQLLFYLYLFLKNKKVFIKEENTFSRIEVNVGFLTPSNREKPEKYLLNLKPREYINFIEFMEEKYENIIVYILQHMLNTTFFYFAEDKLTCRFCNYRLPCQSLRN